MLALEKNMISKATLGRLPQYLQMLKELPEEDYPYISATAIAKHLSLGEVQVRKDLAAVSGAGKPKLGYVTADLIRILEKQLGQDDCTAAILVGAGKLGRALLDYEEFRRFGVEIVAAFDNNQQTLQRSGRVEVLPIQQLEAICTSRKVQLGIITVGVGSAQTVCDQMIKCGITAIWNFAPCRLSVPEHVLLQNENLALSLAHLNSQLRREQAIR